jgi:CHAT domain-containing protein
MEALEIAERGKARAFLDMLANKSTRRVETVIGTGNGGNAGGNIQLASAESGSRAVEIVGKRSVDVVTKGTDDPAQEEAVVEETAISPINAAAPTIDEIKQILSKRQSTCVEYLLTGDKIYVWVLGADGSVRMPPPIENVPQLRAVVQALTAKMTTSSANRDELIRHNFDRQTQLHQLYSALIKPIEQWLPADKNSVITVIPDDFLFSVPFAALLDDHLRFLVEGHTLSYAPAIGVLRATQKLEDEVAEAPHKLLAFGNPITPEVAKVLGALPYTEKEVNHIAKLYGPDRSTVIIGAEANKETFKKLINGASEIHLATHGLVDQEHPMRSALVLAPSGEGDNGLLSVRDILTLPNLKARLVVLSACQTGKGQIAKDGVVGLSRAFIIAGTPSILVSQWNVDDAMTEFQMTRFYHSYLDGMDKARALREAQLETIRFMENVPEGQPIQPDPSKPRANPRYWAAFQLIGESK